MKRRAALALALSALSVAPALAAAPGHSYGFGSRSNALGGAVAAGPGEAASVFYNPALLALAPHSQLSLGYRAVSTSLEVEHQDAGIAGLSTLDGAVLGRAQFLGIPVGFGLGLALSNGHLSRVRTLSDDEPHWPLHETLPELLDLSAALALQPTSWLALGIGSGFLATTRGGFEVEGTAVQADGKGAEYDSQLRHSVDAQLVSVRYLLLGAELLVPPSLSPFGIDGRIGLAYRGEAKLEQALRGTLEGTVDAGFLQVPVRYVFQSHTLVAYQPRQIVLGVHGAHPLVSAEVDIAWEQWSRYPSPLPRTGTSIAAEVPAGLPLDLPENQALKPAELAGFDDRFTFRIGVERKLPLSTASDVMLRGSFAYLPTPAPASLDRGQLLDADEFVFGLGAGLELRELSRRLPRELALDAHGLWSRLPNRHHHVRGPQPYVIMGKGNVYSAGLTLTASFGRAN